MYIKNDYEKLREVFSKEVMSIMEQYNNQLKVLRKRESEINNYIQTVLKQEMLIEDLQQYIRFTE